MTTAAAGPIPEEPLSAPGVAAALRTRRLGRPTLCFPLVVSTNDVAHEQAAAGAGDGLLVIAEAQTAGRGRLARRWWAPPGTSLLMSLLLRPPLPLHLCGQLTMCLGLGCCEGIEEVTGLPVRLKWPNDLMLYGRKLGGMLTELRSSGDRLDYAVLGLGLNVNTVFQAAAPAAQQAEEQKEWAALSHSATSLKMALGISVSRTALLAAILLHCESWYDRLLGGEPPHQAWAARLETLGRRVRIALPGGELEGVAAGITAEGALLLETSPGTLRTVWSGDVAAVRPGE